MVLMDLIFTPRAADHRIYRVKKAIWRLMNLKVLYATFRIGLGYIGDFTAYSQSKVFKQQMDSLGLDLTPSYKTRDFRILVSGRLLKMKRYVAYKFAYMYDGDKKVWMMQGNRSYDWCSGIKRPYFYWSYKRRIFNDQGNERTSPGSPMKDKWH